MIRKFRTGMLKKLGRSVGKSKSRTECVSQTALSTYLIIIDGQNRILQLYIDRNIKRVNIKLINSFASDLTNTYVDVLCHVRNYECNLN